MSQRRRLTLDEEVWLMCAERSRREALARAPCGDIAPNVDDQLFRHISQIVFAKLRAMGAIDGPEQEPPPAGSVTESEQD